MDGWMDMFDMLSTRIAEHATLATLTSGLWCDNNDNNVEQGNMRHKLVKGAGTLGDGGRRHKHKVIATICSLREWTTDKGATTAAQPAELPSIWTEKGRGREGAGNPVPAQEERQYVCFFFTFLRAAFRAAFCHI